MARARPKTTGGVEVQCWPFHPNCHFVMRTFWLRARIIASKIRTSEQTDLVVPDFISNILTVSFVLFFKTFVSIISFSSSFRTIALGLYHGPWGTLTKMTKSNSIRVAKQADRHNNH